MKVLHFPSGDARRVASIATTWSSPDREASTFCRNGTGRRGSLGKRISAARAAERGPQTRT
jgi:hypothetical protein